jgi:hypothetical protein
MLQMNTGELRERAARTLSESGERVRGMSAFVGLDGFVDEIIHAVDTRKNAEEFARLPMIADFGGRISQAAGKSTNIELVNVKTKLGGNGPILTSARWGIRIFIQFSNRSRSARMCIRLRRAGIRMRWNFSMAK